MPFPRSACSNWCAAKASRPDTASRTSTERRSIACAATCCRWSISNRELQLTAAASPARAGQHRGSAGRRPAVWAGGRRDQRHRRDRRQAAGQATERVSCFAGATIMGDGHVALILDVLGLAQMARVVTSCASRTCQQAAKSTREARRSANRGCCSASAAPDGWPFRCRWSRGWRNFPARQVERSAGHEVIQYREQIMPLVRLSQVLGLRRRRRQRPAAGHRVFQRRPQRGPGGGRNPGHRRPRRRCSRSARPATLKGAAVIQQRVTDLLDVPALAGRTATDGMREGAEA